MIPRLLRNPASFLTSHSSRRGTRFPPEDRPRVHPGCFQHMDQHKATVQSVPWRQAARFTSQRLMAGLDLRIVKELSGWQTRSNGRALLWANRK